MSIRFVSAASTLRLALPSVLTIGTGERLAWGFDNLTPTPVGAARSIAHPSQLERPPYTHLRIGG